MNYVFLNGSLDHTVIHIIIFCIISIWIFLNSLTTFLLGQVVSPFPPSDKIGINSVQREAEEIVPMKQMKMDWIPYIPLENRYCHFFVQSYYKGILTEYVTFFFKANDSFQLSSFFRDSQVERLKSQIFILGCTQRRYNFILHSNSV